MGFMMAPAEDADMRERAINNLIMATASLQAAARLSFCHGCVFKPTVEEQAACQGCAAWLDRANIEIEEGKRHGVQAEAEARQVGRSHKYSD